MAFYKRRNQKIQYISLPRAKRAFGDHFQGFKKARNEICRQCDYIFLFTSGRHYQRPRAAMFLPRFRLITALQSLFPSQQNFGFARRFFIFSAFDGFFFILFNFAAALGILFQFFLLQSFNFSVLF